MSVRERFIPFQGHLDEPAFIRGERSISYRTFSRDIANVQNVLAEELLTGTQIVALSSYYGGYLHWVIHCACVNIGVATVQLRSQQPPLSGAVYLSPKVADVIPPDYMLANDALIDRPEPVPGAALMATFDALLDYPERLNRLILTSGTTGEPKAVALTNGILHKRLIHVIERDDLSSSERVMVLFGRDTAGGFQQPYSALLRGATIILDSPSTVAPEQLRAAVNRSTRLNLTPAMLHHMVLSNQDAVFADSQDRIVTTSGSRIEPTTVSLALNTLCCEVRSIYGSTEVSGVALASLQSEPADPRFAGYISQDVKVKIFSEEGRELPKGEPGIVAIQTPWMVNSYWKSEASTVFQDGWFYPGDTGYVLSDGQLFIDGRIDDRLIFRGEKFSAPALETKVRKIHSVSDAFITVLTEDGTDRLVVMVTIDGSEADVRPAIGRTLRGWPFTMIIADSIPRNHMGKLERKALTRYCGLILEEGG